MRITAGSHRGRVLHVPDLPGLRPTPSKVREALYNILGSVDGFTMLDLFAGSGIMAIEALSRGARSALSIEQHGKACRLMQESRQTLDLGNWEIVRGSLPAALSRVEGSSFDLVFADPPYNQGIAEKIPAWLDQHGISCRHLVVEEASRASPCWPKGWTPTQSRRYGDTCLHFLEPEKGTK